MVATACAAMPSSLPVKPSFSVVVALTEMRDASTARIAARRAAIAAACGAIFGRSQIRVTSALASNPRRAAMREINARGRSMRMPVMNIREMRVRMRDRRMGMRMGVRLVAIPREIVLVLVMRVVPMTMRVIQRDMRVRMLVTFADVQPDT